MKMMRDPDDDEQNLYDNWDEVGSTHSQSHDTI